jgi:hypothetical protein
MRRIGNLFQADALVLLPQAMKVCGMKANLNVVRVTLPTFVCNFSILFFD